jgi:hypothetical protein
MLANRASYTQWENSQRYIEKELMLNKPFAKHYKSTT